jgi:hypothetical protein
MKGAHVKSLKSAVFPLVLLAAITAAPAPSSAAPVVIDFEGLFEADAVGTISTSGGDITFTNALIMTALSTLPEDVLPPRSGANVAGDLASLDLNTFEFVSAGFMRLDFSAAVSSFSGYFTYFLETNPYLVLEAYDLGGTLLASVQSAFSENLAEPGNPLNSNEFLALVAPGIRYVIITGDPGGLDRPSFVVDDITVEFQQVTTPDPDIVPEPATLALLAMGCAALARRRRARGGLVS